MDSQNIYQEVQEHYGSVARTFKDTAYSGAVAKAFGYSEDELSSIPKQANLGVSCGNPLAIASLREASKPSRGFGETVIDLGSGAGFDVFLAARKVGPKGRAIGVDMNKDMLARARENQAGIPDSDNISFVEAVITSIPLPDGTADCIISNCVINLVPEAEKPAVFKEMARLLRPGGRVAISDILARKVMPAELRESVALYVGCIAGCNLKEDYARWLEESGFGDVVIADTNSDLNVYVDMAKDPSVKDPDTAGCCGPPAKEASKTSCCSTAVKAPSDISLGDINLNEWAGSFKIFAVKK
ncbi:S-adenosyl-L-methionine-dependent methyltransferase [Westerdykella ornata]|uniref:Arsenite methyltransferase n=1 Tax=Westerdykella ornata TaxID=318751 RepID=A0A6A6JJC9_WESOR|nr:S-adenosyl-L-methionine-dependent methyltransferase [Westerdykella ornata]KAF2276243.1 S-adenosyl-L-methionine-dependent methyltransferase [Westerdykella ornata]